MGLREKIAQRLPLDVVLKIMVRMSDRKRNTFGKGSVRSKCMHAVWNDCQGNGYLFNVYIFYI